MLDNPYAPIVVDRRRSSGDGERDIARAARLASSLRPLPPLPQTADVVFLTPQSPNYGRYLPAYNLRTTLRPALRALCRSASGVITVVEWLRRHNLSFAVRAGGHSFEGLSQSTEVVVDLRLMNRVVVNRAERTATIDGGASLRDVYRSLAATGLAFAAGSCPTVGVAGHCLGGGMGLLGRSHGLTCDNLLSISVVDARGRLLEASANTHPDLFWASRGGGGGSFGIATRFVFRLHPIAIVATFGVGWLLAPTDAQAIFSAWQAWATNAPASITAILKVEGRAEGKIALRCIGQSVGPIEELRRELGRLIAVHRPNSGPTIRPRPFLEAVEHFSGGSGYPVIHHKGRSDFVSGGLAGGGISALLDGVRRAATAKVVAICDAYGGRVADFAPDATAFPHRDRSLFCIQYYSQWNSASQTAERVRLSREVYDAMRPFVTGRAYVNYCDLDVRDWEVAYWGANLPRLRRIKGAYDPSNMFRHRQSVPLP